MKCILSSLLMLVLLQPAKAQRAYNKTEGGPLSIAMVKVQGGYFDMGSDDESDATDRKPAHTVRLSTFNISAYEVTQELWCQVMDTNPGYYTCKECPVTNVTWADIQTFISKLNAMKGRHYRLPTEAEWEYAARGGVFEKSLVKEHTTARGGVNALFVCEENENLRRPTKYKTGKKYAGKHEAQPVAWYAENSKDRLHEVGRKQPNELGIYDMSGNAEEWVSDWYANSYGSRDTVENPSGPVSGKSHSVRGGSWNSTLSELVVTNRKGYLPKTKTNYLGFRLVEDIQ
jgi:formylglycine-generating enzyme required for sulfatase activity